MKTFEIIIAAMIIFASVGTAWANENEKRAENVKIINFDNSTVSALEDAASEKQMRNPKATMDYMGNVMIWMKVNMSFCGETERMEKYYLVPEQVFEWTNGTYAVFENKIMGIDNCRYDDHYEWAQFGMLEKKLPPGRYKLYRDFDSYPLFISEIIINGELPPATLASEPQVNYTLLDQMIMETRDFISLMKSWMGFKESNPQLDISTDDWVRVGEKWELAANYTDNGKPVVNGMCRLNTNKWGIINMSYDWKTKQYYAYETSNDVGEIKWTVACY